MYYLETITAIGLKVGLNVQINELMKLNEYQSPGYYLTLVKGHSDFKRLSYESLWVHGNENIYK